MSSSPISRRSALVTAAASVCSASVNPALAQPARRRTLRLAHLTDIHLQPERAAARGLAECLRHVQALKDPPQLILNGGDSVMDVFATSAQRAKVQADLWHKVWKDECSLPVEHCIGNHDVWGWNKEKSQTTGDEPGWGKAWALELLGLKQRYRSFDRAGWHFVVLDSTFPKGDGYTARLDDEQFDWLARDLAGTPATTPVLVLTHIPILAVCAYFDGENEKSGDWRVPGAWMHIDARRIKDLFLQHRNVKLCLSGHEHMVDRCEYLGVSYICNGAVSGGWWKGPYHEFEPGYGLIDLHDDGSFGWEFVRYPWTPVPEPGDRK